MLLQATQALLEVVALKSANDVAEVRLLVEHGTKVGVLEQPRLKLVAVEGGESSESGVESDIGGRDELRAPRLVSLGARLNSRIGVECANGKEVQLTWPSFDSSASLPMPVKALAALSKLPVPSDATP